MAENSVAPDPTLDLLDSNLRRLDAIAHLLVIAAEHQDHGEGYAHCGGPVGTVFAVLGDALDIEIACIRDQLGAGKGA